jgi:hypothetical protein
MQEDQELLASVGISDPIDELRQAIADRLLSLSGDDSLFEDDVDDDGLDVRLFISDHASSWEVLWGDVSFDSDYRGFCGASAIHQGLDLEECLQIAQELLDQALDLIAQSQSGVK